MEDNKDINNNDFDTLKEDNKNNNEDFHLDPTNGEDRRKILASYKKSLRKRAFAPLIGGNVGINPIDLLKEEEAEKENNQTLDIYDLADKRITSIEKKVNQALSLARIALCLSVGAIILLFLLLYVK